MDKAPVSVCPFPNGCDLHASCSACRTIRDAQQESDWKNYYQAEIDRLTSERDAALSNMSRANRAYGAAEQRAEKAEAELAEVKAALAKPPKPEDR